MHGHEQKDVTKLQWLENPCRKTVHFEGYGRKEAQKVRRFHESIPDYRMTNLVKAVALADKLDIESFYVKDESARFGLNAFKGLGGSYCIASVLQEKLGIPGEPDYARIVGCDRKKREELTFATATDGNHGRGIAWAARMFGASAVVFLPAGSADERVENIRHENARVFVTQEDYDATVRLASETAEKEGWILTQDTAWEGYEDYPGRIMQGYLTMGEEIVMQTGQVPTHILLQAGVGSMAASLCAYFRDVYGEGPRISVIEATEADCLYQTALAHDGQMHGTRHSMRTMMAGLCCGMPCTIAARMLMDQADDFITIEDGAAADGMRLLAKEGIRSGESGASTTGALWQIARDPEGRKKLGLSRDSVVLCLSTEGATDGENYRRIVFGNE